MYDPEPLRAGVVRSLNEIPGCLLPEGTATQNSGTLRTNTMFGVPREHQRHHNPYADPRREPYYHPRAPPRGRRRSASWRQQLLWSLAALASVSAWYLTPVSDWIVSVVITQIPVQSDWELQERALVEGDLGRQTIYSPTWSPVILSVGNELVRTYGHSPELRQMYDIEAYDWNFGIVRSDAVNAFCLPAGYIRVTDALLRILKPTRGEVAALLGHEMGHVLSRHAQKRILSQQLLQCVVTALMGEDQRGRQETFGMALGDALMKSASWLGQQKFSRRDEFQADSVSWDLLMSENNSYNPRSLESLLAKLKSLEKERDPNDPAWVANIEAWSRTHPATADRLEAVIDKWVALSLAERRKFARNPI